MIVDRAIYREGKRTPAPESLTELNSACRNGAGIAWIGLYRPDASEFATIAREFDLHALAVEDAVKAHQRPKVERYGDTLFLVLRPARYVDETETVEFGEVHVFAGPQFVITVRHAEAPDLHSVREKLEARPELLSRGPFAIVHAILDRVVDDYGPVVAGLENDIDEIEDDVFDGSPNASRRIYDLTREVIEFQRATRPLSRDPRFTHARARRRRRGAPLPRDVQDHALRVQEHADAFRELLQNILSVNLTLETKVLSEAAIDQNEEVKKISAWRRSRRRPWSARIYGMNFDHMPELHWMAGYPFALALMVSTSVGLYLLFKRRGCRSEP